MKNQLPHAFILTAINLFPMNNDCLMCILKYATKREIGHVLLLCKQYNSVADIDMVWKSLFADNFKQIVVRDNYKSKYRQFDSLDKFLGKTINKKLSNVYNSRELNLDKNRLSSLPIEICLLVNLQELYLSNNQLSSLPSEIGLLVNLQTLSLTNNKLSSLPSGSHQLLNHRFNNDGTHLHVNSGVSPLFMNMEIGSLINLQELYLGYMQLSSLPPQIGLLTKLCTLSLYKNQLSSLPSEIGLLVNLQTLYIGRAQSYLIPANLERVIRKI